MRRRRRNGEKRTRYQLRAACAYRTVGKSYIHCGGKPTGTRAKQETIVPGVISDTAGAGVGSFGRRGAATGGGVGQGYINHLLSSAQVLGGKIGIHTEQCYLWVCGIGRGARGCRLGLPLLAAPSPNSLGGALLSSAHGGPPAPRAAPPRARPLLLSFFPSHVALLAVGGVQGVEAGEEVGAGDDADDLRGGRRGGEGADLAGSPSLPHTRSPGGTQIPPALPPGAEPSPLPPGRLPAATGVIPRCHHRDDYCPLPAGATTARCHHRGDFCPPSCPYQPRGCGGSCGAA